MALDKNAVPGLVILSVGMVLSTAIAARSWVGVRLHRDHAIEATGSAKRRIVSDLIEWTGTIKTENADRTTAARAVKDHMTRTLAYLKKAGIAQSELEVSSVSTEDDIETEYKGSGEIASKRRASRASRSRRA